LKGRGGAEKVVLEYAKNSEHEVTVATLFYDEKSTFEGFKDVETEVIGSNKAPSGFVDKGLRFGIGAMLRKLPLDNYDALIVSEAGIGSLITLRNHHIPVLAYVHTPLRPALPEFKEEYRKEKHVAVRPLYDFGINIYNILEDIGWGYIDKVVANSQLTKERIHKKGLKLEKEIEVVNPGADKVEKKGDYKKYFFYPSRFREYKRQDLAIEAFEEADLDDFKLILAGSAQEGPYIEKLREMAGENVEIKTDVPEEEWKELYQNAYTVLFMAEKEDWGIVPLEAGMNYKPVISVNEGSPRETVKDGETGFLVDANPGKIAEKMELLANNRDKTVEIGEKGREEAEKYSWENFAEKLDEKVEEIY
jgi:glycosyltransferase involved in cell wall biosynthesis